MGGSQPFDVAEFLSERLRPAQVAAVSSSGSPVLGSFWFLFAEGHFWFSSRMDTPIVRAFQRGSQVAVIVDDFSPPGSIRQVRVRGPGRIERHDATRVEAIYRRYLGDELERWPDAFRARLGDSTWALWTVEPLTGLVACYPNFQEAEFRWLRREDSPLPAT